MDQGLAALIAGGFGLVGAGIGGTAAVWGAKQQVRDQAAIEHSHWNRQMRREAYEAYLTEIYEVIDSLTEMVRAISAGDTVQARDQLERRLNRLIASGSRVALAGPGHVNRLAYRASRALHEVGSRLEAVQTRSELAATDYEPLLEAAGQAAEQFSNGARLILQNPPHSPGRWRRWRTQ